MSYFICWDCGKECHIDKLLEIPVFDKKQAIYWCFSCANKQLKIVNYEIVRKKS